MKPGWPTTAVLMALVIELPSMLQARLPSDCVHLYGGAYVIANGKNAHRIVALAAHAVQHLLVRNVVGAPALERVVNAAGVHLPHR